MKKEYLANEAKFVCSRNELNYQEVLDSFPSASEITIITYNISEKKEGLIRALQSVGEKCVISVITNIPGRWEYYYGDSFREKANQKINLYLSKLNPEDLGIKSNVYFDFSNHGKIIMTDSIIYVGSANFSEESGNNTEFGFISSDKQLINFVRSEVLPELKNSAVPYYEYDFTALQLEANVMLSALFNVRDNLYEEVYRLHDDFDGEWYYYIEHEANLSVTSLNRIVSVTKEACKLASKVYDAINTIVSSDEDETDTINEIYEELLDIRSRIELIRSSKAIINLSKFDIEKYTLHALQEEYAFEAYDENLEPCVEKAHSEAQSIVWELTQAAKEDIDSLIVEADQFIKEYSTLIDRFRSKQIKKISPKIDNTSLEPQNAWG